MEVDSIVADKAYSSKENLKMAKENNMRLSARLSSVIDGNRTNKLPFEYNKDANLYVCPAGHLAKWKEMNNRKMTSVTETPALPIILMWTNARSVHYVKVATRKEPRQKHMRLPSNRMNSWSKSNIKNRRVYKSSEETIQDRSQKLRT